MPFILSASLPVLGKVMVVRSSQPETTPVPISSRASGRVMEVRAFPEKAPPPSFFRPLGRVTEVSPQLLKAFSPISRTEAGMVTEVRAEQPQKA